MPNPIKSASFCCFNYNALSSNSAKLAGASTLLIAAGILTALSLTQTIPFQCLYGAGALFVLDAALASVILIKKRQAKYFQGVLPELPYELLINIFENLDFTSLIAASGVSQAWREAANDSNLKLKHTFQQDKVYLNFSLSNMACCLLAFKRKRAPKYTHDSPFKRLVLPSDRIISSSGPYAGKMRLKTRKIVAQKKHIITRDRKLAVHGQMPSIDKISYSFQCYIEGTTLYCLKGKRSFTKIVTKNFQTNESKTYEIKGRYFRSLCVTGDAVVISQGEALCIFSKNNMSFIKRTNDIGSIGKHIFAYRKKIYFCIDEDQKLIEFDLEKEKTRTIEWRNFWEIKQPISKFILSNGIIFIQLRYNQDILRYDIDRDKWLTKLTCPEYFNLQAAFSGLVFAVSNNGKDQVVWDFCS